MLRRRTEVSPFAPSAVRCPSRRLQGPRALSPKSTGLALGLALAASFLVACSQLGGQPAPIEIVDPAGTVYTNGITLVRIQVTGPAEEDVELLLDGVAAGERVEPLLWELDTTALAEGQYSLVARAPWNGQIRTSVPLTVVVDRTAPTLLLANSLPNDKSMTAWLRDPVVAVFSEPLDPGSVTAGRFTVSDPFGPLGLRLELSADGRSLFAYHVEVPVLPTKVEAELSLALTDRAGNGMVLPESEWSWALLSWLLPGGDEEILGTGSSYGSKVSLGSAPDGRLFLAREENVHKEAAGGTDYDVIVSVWDGSSWSQLGGPAEGDDPFLHGNEPSLTVLPDGTPVVALYDWLDDPSIPNNGMRVSRWNGSSWVQMGEIMLADDSSAYEPSIATGPDGLPVIAYAQSGLPGKITVQRWSGAEWEALGKPLGTAAVSLVEVAVDEQNRPLVVWGEDGKLQLARWQNSAWTLLGGANSINLSGYATSPAVAPLSDGTPVVVWRDAADHASTASRIMAAKWDDSGGWQSVGELELASGTPGTPSIAPAAGVGAYISWPQSGQIHVANWDGSSTVLLPGPVNEAVGTSGSEPDIVVAHGVPVVAWSENEGAWVRSYNGLP